MYHHTGNYWPGQNYRYGRNHGTFYREITIVEAMDIAMQQVPGQVVKVELDMEKGRKVYEVDIVTSQGIKYEVSVDVNTGEVVEVELD
ncbi:PepSY domain-containing protein [Oceanobacillus sp. Castelsardo]|uniref:PepSY domain-containing protein n=1 Tax=Oceanobacillus sp. Castelsardo TaxID=1851204 RepID=UPI0009EDEED8|nr:PepSY domain-containing protein [Oceanobacillus sp. Castelsardo]